MADYTFLERQGAGAARDERLAWLREFAVLPRGRGSAALDLPGQVARRLAGDRVPQGGLRLRHAARRDRCGRVRVGVRRFWQAHRFASRELERPRGTRSRRRVRLPLAALLRAVGAPRRRSRARRSGVARRRRPRILRRSRRRAPPYALAIPVRVETAAEPTPRTVRLDEARASTRSTSPATPRALASIPTCAVPPPRPRTRSRRSFARWHSTPARATVVAAATPPPGARRATWRPPASGASRRSVTHVRRCPPSPPCSWSAPRRRWRSCSRKRRPRRARRRWRQGHGSRLGRTPAARCAARRRRGRRRRRAAGRGRPAAALRPAELRRLRRRACRRPRPLAAAGEPAARRRSTRPDRCYS